jgi:hypothetical protein
VGFKYLVRATTQRPNGNNLVLLSELEPASVTHRKDGTRSSSMNIKDKWDFASCTFWNQDIKASRSAAHYYHTNLRNLRFRNSERWQGRAGRVGSISIEKLVQISIASCSNLFCYATARSTTSSKHGNNRPDDNAMDESFQLCLTSGNVLTTLRILRLGSV